MATAKSKFNLALFAIIAVAAVILAGGLIGLQQLTSKNAELKREYDRKLAEKTELTEQLGMMKQRQQELAELDRKLQSVDEELVDYEYMPTYLEEIQQTAINTGNVMLSIAPQEPRPFNHLNSPIVKGRAGKPSPKGRGTKVSPTGYWTRQINLRVDGNYISILKLLDELRTFPKLVYVRTISLTPGSKRLADGLTAQIETYAIIPPNQYLTPPDEDGVPPTKDATPANDEKVASTSGAEVSHENE